MAESSEQNGIGRRWLVAPILTAAALLCLASHAGAATVNLGQIAPMGPTGGCGGCTFFQQQTDAASPSYVVPPGGPWRVTSWTTRGGSMPDSARLRILRPTAFAGQFQLVAESSDVAVAAVAAPVTPVSIPVLPGDRISLYTQGSGDMPAGQPAFSASDRISFVMGGPFVLGQTTGPGGTFPYGTNAVTRMNLAATLTAPDPTPAKKCKKKKEEEGEAGRVGGEEEKEEVPAEEEKEEGLGRGAECC